MSLRIILKDKRGKSYATKGDETLRTIVDRYMRLSNNEPDLEAVIQLKWTKPREPTSRCQICGCVIARGAGLCGECICEDDVG